MEYTTASGPEVKLTPLGEVLWHPASEMLRAVVSGASTIVLLYVCMHLFKSPKFANFYEFFDEHMVAKGSADFLSLALLLASLSCLLSNWNWRKYFDQWFCKPIIRLLTHLYGLGTGALVGKAVFSAVNSQFQDAAQALLSANSFFWPAVIATVCFATTELATEKFTEGVRKRIIFATAWSVTLFIVAVLMFAKPI